MLGLSGTWFKDFKRHVLFGCGTELLDIQKLLRPEGSAAPTRSYGFTRWSVPQQEGPLLTSGCCPPLPASYWLCCGCHGNPQCRLQWFPWRVLHGGVVLLFRHVSYGVLSGRHSSLQLPPRVLGQPHGHMCCLCYAHVSHDMFFFSIHPSVSQSRS